MKLPVLVAALSGLLAACATGPEPRTIIVDGSARVRVEPDVFNVSASFRTRNPDQSAGLSELARKLAQVRQDVPRLEGLRSSDIDASDIELTSVPEPDCVRSAGYSGDAAKCPVTGRYGSIDVTIVGSPPNRAGQVVSLLSEMGAETVELNSYNLSDSAAAQSKAIAAAVADARAKADAIAAASGAVITGLAKLQYGRGFAEAGMASAFSLEARLPEQQQAVTTTRPAIDLNVDPSPIEVEAAVTAAFVIQ